jgi:hypothetical protein
MWCGTILLGLVHVDAEALVSEQGGHGAGLAVVS